MYYVPVRVHKNRLLSTFYNSVVSQAFKVKAAFRVVICYRGSRVTKSFSWILLNVRSCTLKFKKTTVNLKYNMHSVPGGLEQKCEGDT